MRRPSSSSSATRYLLFLVLLVGSLTLSTLVFVALRPPADARGGAGGGVRAGLAPGDDEAASRALQAERTLRLLRKEHAKFIEGLEPWDAHVPPNDFETFKAPQQPPPQHPRGGGGARPPPLPPQQQQQRVLVVYTYADAPWRERNLRFFLRHGVLPALADGTPVDYTFILHGPPPLALFRELNVPYQVMVVTEDRRQEAEGEVLSWGQELPGRAAVRIVLRDNVGFDYCGARLVLQHGWAARAGAYTHFVLISSAARGPFVPAYASAVLTWLDAFLDQLSDRVRLVGATINCLDSLRAAGSGEFRALHLQSHLLATDLAGLRAMAPHLQCYRSASEAASHGEVGMTQAVLAAGHSAAVLQGSWRGLELSSGALRGQEVARRCSAVSDEGGGGGDPGMPGAYLRGDVHPLETLFVKTSRNFDEGAVTRWSFMFNSFQRGEGGGKAAPEGGEE